jgi:uncharacterized Fe-S cluster-containing radical SAM superfamily protein
MAPVTAPPGKFQHPTVTANGEARAIVPLRRLETLWFNTGTLCNLTCTGCYIQSSPHNDRLAWLTRAEVRPYLVEAAEQRVAEIGFTGGEPFVNPDILDLIADSLAAGFRVLVLTNAMRPMQRLAAPLAALNHRYPGRLTLRVSLDHFRPETHERLRGPRSWQPALDGLGWLAREGFALAVAGRRLWGDDEATLRAGYRALFARLGLAINADDPSALVLFPELDEAAEVPEITERCWGLLGKTPASVMCAWSRMVVKAKAAERPTVVACTLIPEHPGFTLGETLSAAARPVALNHRHCARFCVLGGASCSPQGSHPA